MEPTQMTQPEQPETHAAAQPLPPEDMPVTLTPKAVEMVKTTREQEGIDAAHGLRIAVRGGGCSGFEYALDFESEARPNDFVYEQSGLTIYVDGLERPLPPRHEHRLRPGDGRRGIQVQQPQGHRHLRLRLVVRRLI